MKQELHQCKECLYYFQTIDGLVNHLLEKHNQVIALQHAKDKRSCNIPSTSTNSSKELEIIDISDDEPSEKTEIKDEILNSFKNFAKISVANKIKNKDTSTVTKLKRKLNINGCLNVKHEEMYNTWNVAIDKKVTGYNLYDSMIDIKSEEYILPDVYYDVKISPNTDTSLTNSLPLESTQSISNFITDTSPVNNDGIILKLDLNEEIKKCVHYNDLTHPCNYKCKLCPNVNIFPNRYVS